MNQHGTTPSNHEEPDVDEEQLERENARSDADRLPEGPPGLGSSDGEVPPDAIRGPIGEGVQADDDTEDYRGQGTA